MNGLPSSKSAEAREAKISLETVREHLRYDPQTGLLWWLVPRPGRKLDKPAGTVRSDGYATLMLHGKHFVAHRLAFALANGHWPKGEVDHIDGDRANNKIENLREVSSQEQCRNKARPSNNKSGVVGVSWHKVRKKWRANIRADHRLRYLGLYDSFDGAVAARKAAETELGFHENNGRSNPYKPKTTVIEENDNG